MTYEREREMSCDFQTNVWRFTYKGYGDWWWSPGTFLQAQNRLYKPDMLNAQKVKPIHEKLKEPLRYNRKEKKQME